MKEDSLLEVTDYLSRGSKKKRNLFLLLVLFLEGEVNF